MGELTPTEYRIFIFALCMLLIYPFVFALASPLLGSVQSYNRKVPEEFSAVDVMSFADVQGAFVFWNSSNAGDENYVLYYFSLAGWNCWIEAVPEHYNNYTLVLGTYSGWWIFQSYEQMIWKTVDGRYTLSKTIDGCRPFSIDYVDTYYDVDREYAEFLVVSQSNDKRFYVYISRGNYSTAREAWDHEALEVLVCCGWDSTNTGTNIWAIIGSFLTGQIPGIPFPFSIVFTIIFYASLALLIYILLFKWWS